MRAEMKILRAFCVELEREVSIDEARVEFFRVEESKRSRFEFLCSDPDCRHHAEHAVKVVGVNYDKLCSDGDNDSENVVIKAAHFRKNHKFQHAPSCEWVLFNAYENQEKKHDEESETEYKQRQLRKKLNHFVQVFVPDSGDGTTVDPVEMNADDMPFKNEHDSLPIRQSRSTTERKPAKTQTQFLSKLVDSWREAKSVLPVDEFNRLELVVKGQETVMLKDFFMRVGPATRTSHRGVIYGGAKLSRWYGSGFKLSFFDRLDGKPLHIYCDNRTMQSYRHRRYIREVLNSDADYFNVYIRAAELKENDNSYTYEVKDLKNFHAIGVHKKQAVV